MCAHHTPFLIQTPMSCNCKWQLGRRAWSQGGHLLINGLAELKVYSSCSSTLTNLSIFCSQNVMSLLSKASQTVAGFTLPPFLIYLYILTKVFSFYIWAQIHYWCVCTFMALVTHEQELRMLPINCSWSSNELVLLIINGHRVTSENQSHDQFIFKKEALAHVVKRIKCFKRHLLNCKRCRLQKRCSA